MDDFWLWLEMHPLAARIGESAWFPFLESVHVLTAMFVVGSILFVDLRLLGLAATRYSVSRYASELLRWTWMSFAIASIGGFGMFVTRASWYVANRAFQIKLLLLGIAALNMLCFHFIGRKDISTWETGAPALAARLAGALSLVAWVGITLAGRWTGHLL